MASSDPRFTADVRERTRAGARLGRGRWLGLPLALVTIWCVLLRPELRSLFAPFFGPWAGHLYGHAQCTLASVAPTATIVAVALGCLLVALAASRKPALRRAAWLLGVPWALSWAGMALLSVANTCA